MKLTQKEDKPSSVSARPKAEQTKQDGETPGRWSWVNPMVWTERMLATLEEGIKGGKWFSLMDKVYAVKTLWVAGNAVYRNGGAPGVDQETVEEFKEELMENVGKLSRWLQEGSYEPMAIRRVYIPKPGSQELRPLGIPTVRDRTVQGAVRLVIEPIFVMEFAEHSYGFRPGRGCKDGLRRVDELLKKGYVYVVDADLKSYFDTIPHARLMERVREKIADGRVLELIESYLKAKILEELKEWEPEAGAPQGAVLSPLLSNIYLNRLDHLMVERGREMVRYADDFVILCHSEGEATQTMEEIKTWCEAEGLTLHLTKTKIVDVRKEPFDFLGFRFVTTRRGKLTRWPRKKSMDKFKDSIREKTKRTNGSSLKEIIKKVNRSLVGWFGYFKHSLATTFDDLDSWIRMRLRSILRKRDGRRGKGYGADHQRYPNSLFKKMKLFSLKEAYILGCQSPSG